jgi:hypothetical protein
MVMYWTLTANKTPAAGIIRPANRTRQQRNTKTTGRRGAYEMREDSTHEWNKTKQERDTSSDGISVPHIHMCVSHHFKFSPSRSDPYLVIYHFPLSVYKQLLLQLLFVALYENPISEMRQ